MGRAPILDGNVKRVLARYHGIEGWPGQTAVANTMWSLAEELTPKTRVADYTQAIMDLGATLCSRTSPACAACPFEHDCVARRAGRVVQLPGKKPKKQMPVKSTCMLLIENADGEFLLEKRPGAGLWGGLWSFPECDQQDLDVALTRILGTLHERSRAPFAARSSKLDAYRHTFTHFHLDITPVHVKVYEAATTIGEPTSPSRDRRGAR